MQKKLFEMLFRKFNGILNQINSLVDKIIKKQRPIYDYLKVLFFKI
jgi:hypothetical protein